MVALSIPENPTARAFSMAFLPILLLLLNTTLLAYSSDFKFPKETILGGPDSNDVVCPDQESHCPTGTTCCLISGGAYGCCPIPRAVCCSDHVHCCPHGYTCDLQHSQCLNEESSQSHPLSRKFPAKTRPQLSQPHHASVQREEAASANTNDNAEVVCPDGHSMCPEHTTCCPIDVPNGGKQFWKVIAMKRSGGQSTRYGCCPAEQAVCCADHMHCCPHGTQCDMQARRCAPQNIGRRRTESENSDELFSNQQQQPLLRHTHRSSSKKVAVAHSTPTELMMEPTMQICAKSNGKHHSQVASVCPAGGKCCRHRNPLNGRKWDGCCPFADGQCCAHSGHCCPAGFACGVPGEDGAEDRCINEQRSGVTLSTRMVPTVMASKQKANKLNCCKDDGSNQVGAVCCPHGYKCTGAGKSSPSRCEQLNTRERITQLLFGSGGQDEENY